MSKVTAGRKATSAVADSPPGADTSEKAASPAWGSTNSSPFSEKPVWKNKQLPEIKYKKYKVFPNIQWKLDLVDTDLAETLGLKDTLQKFWATIFDF